MEAVKFIIRECGNSPQHALHRAITLNLVERKGLIGLGTIADREGSKLQMFSLKNDENPVEQIDEILNTTIKAHDDYIGCIDCKEGEYLFFGWAQKDQGKFIDPTD